MKGVLIKHLLNEKRNGIKYYLNTIDRELYKKFEKDYESIQTTVDINKFVDKWDIKPGDILSYGESPFNKSMTPDEQDAFNALLEGIFDKPEYKYSKLYNRIMPHYKCWCTDKYPELLDVSGHPSALSSFNCLLTKLYYPDYLIITVEKSKTE